MESVESTDTVRDSSVSPTAGLVRDLSSLSIGPGSLAHAFGDGNLASSLALHGSSFFEQARVRSSVVPVWSPVVASMQQIPPVEFQLPFVGARASVSDLESSQDIRTRIAVSNRPQFRYTFRFDSSRIHFCSLFQLLQFRFVLIFDFFFRSILYWFSALS